MYSKHSNMSHSLFCLPPFCYKYFGNYLQQIHCKSKQTVSFKNTDHEIQLTKKAQPGGSLPIICDQILPLVRKKLHYYNQDSNCINMLGLSVQKSVSISWHTSLKSLYFSELILHQHLCYYFPSSKKDPNCHPIQRKCCFSNLKNHST